MAEDEERRESRSVLIRRVAACLDGSTLAERALPHAQAAAAALGAPLTLLRVLEQPGAEGAPADPMEWEIQRREARNYLDQLAAAGPARDTSVEAEVIEGKAAEEICRWCRQREVDLTVVCTHGTGGRSPWALASTARKLLDRAPGSLLLVPTAGDPLPTPPRYRRVLVPIDGSPRAESGLPIAARIASAHGAELLVAHVVPWPELIEFGPLDAEDLELRDRLVRRNQRVASSYLDRLRARLSESHVVPRMLLFQAGDVAGRIARLVVDEHVDLLVLSAHGRSAHAGVPCGGVTAELISRCAVPLLIVRSGANRAMQRVAAPEPAAARLPHLATP
jgi:nucleotide-binding universal stress UspA family protein